MDEANDAKKEASQIVACPFCGRRYMPVLRTPLPAVSFHVDPDTGDLVKRGAPRSGNAYEHRCPRADFEAVAHAVNESDRPVVYMDIAALLGLPHTRVAVAFAFLVERGCLTPAHGRKRRRPDDADVYLDALIEYHALLEKGPEPPAGEQEA